MTVATAFKMLLQTRPNSSAVRTWGSVDNDMQGPPERESKVLKKILLQRYRLSYVPDHFYQKHFLCPRNLVMALGLRQIAAMHNEGAKGPWGKILTIM